jgi:hypothetical protein
MFVKRNAFLSASSIPPTNCQRTSGCSSESFPLGGFRDEQLAQGLGRARARVDAQVLQALSELGHGHRGVDLPVQALDDRARRPGGRRDAVPRGRLVAGHARFGERGDVGKADEAVVEGDRERAQVPALDVRN